MSVNHPVLGRLYFLVEGMKCSHCLWKVENSLSRLPGVRDVSVNLETKTVSLGLSSPLDSEVVEKEILNQGFQPRRLENFDQPLELLRKNNVRHLIRLAVAGACAGNIMLLAVSLYAGADRSEFSSLFGWLTFALFLPILFYAAFPFYQGAYSALKSKQINIDVPMVLVLIAGTALSLYHLFQGSGDTYFDSMAALVFLLLTSRYLVQRLQQRAMSPDLMEPFLRVQEVLKWNPENSKWEKSPVKAVQVGDLVQFQQGEVFTFDGQLEGLDPIYVNSSLFNGESHPQRLLPRSEALAGVRLLSSNAHLRVQKTGEETRLGQLFKNMRQELRTRTPLISLMDIWARRFTVVVLSLAGAFFLAYSFISFDEALKRSLSLILLACPCALAFGVPLTQSLSLYKAIKNGIVFKKAETLEKLSGIRHIFFDKTGTLTKGEISVVRSEPARLSEDTAALVYSLEQNSLHPVGKALAYRYQNCGPVALENWREIPGVGVRAEWKGSNYEMVRSLRSENSETPSSWVCLKKDGKVLAEFLLGDELQPDSRRSLEELRKRFSVQLLTGDQRQPSMQMGRCMGFAPEEIIYEVSPEGKRNTLKSHPHSMMVGDGVNDAPSMAAAEVAVAVHGSMEASLHAADVYLTKSGVSQIPLLFEISRKSQTTVYRILGFSLLYNLSAGSLALTGFINPLIAAVLMPISSFIVILVGWRGTR